MPWTVTPETTDDQRSGNIFKESTRLNVRAIIDIDNEQAEIKDLIASPQKHVKEGA